MTCTFDSTLSAIYIKEIIEEESKFEILLPITNGEALLWLKIQIFGECLIRVVVEYVVLTSEPYPYYAEVGFVHT